MGRIEDKFNELKKRNEKALIAFISAGDPDIETTKALAMEMEKNGADIIELGVPFSDPLADGPTIQKSYIRALKKGVSLNKILEMVKEMRRETNVPLILMSSYNPIFRYGENKFIGNAVSSGVDGVIIPDLPPEESDNLFNLSNKKGLDTIFLLAPTSSKERIKLVCDRSHGFIYYISVTGITGARKLLSRDIEGMIKRIRRSTDLPIAVGFGISTSRQAKEIASCADGIIVGSAIVKIIEKHASNMSKGKNGLVGEVGDFIRSLKNAVRY